MCSEGPFCLTRSVSLLGLLKNWRERFGDKMAGFFAGLPRVRWLYENAVGTRVNFEVCSTKFFIQILPKTFAHRLPSELDDQNVWSNIGQILSVFRTAAHQKRHTLSAGPVVIAVLLLRQYTSLCAA